MFVVLVVVFGFGVSVGDGVVVIWVSKFGGPCFFLGGFAFDHESLCKFTLVELVCKIPEVV